MKSPVNILLLATAVACAIAAPSATAAAAKEKVDPSAVPLKALPEIPKSVFGGQGRNPFMTFGSDRPVEPSKVLQTVSVQDAALRQFEQTAVYSANYIKGEQSWAIINGHQFFLNTRSLLDPRRPDLQNLYAKATVIAEDRVVLMLLDGTSRIVTIKSKQTEPR